jgi:hypothetical protein
MLAPLGNINLEFVVVIPVGDKYCHEPLLVKLPKVIVELVMSNEEVP